MKKVWCLSISMRLVLFAISMRWVLVWLISMRLVLVGILCPIPCASHAAWHNQWHCLVTCFSQGVTTLWDMFSFLKPSNGDQASTALMVACLWSHGHTQCLGPLHSLCSSADTVDTCDHLGWTIVTDKNLSSKGCERVWNGPSFVQRSQCTWHCECNPKTQTQKAQQTNHSFPLCIHIAPDHVMQKWVIVGCWHRCVVGWWWCDWLC